MAMIYLLGEFVQKNKTKISAVIIIICTSKTRFNVGSKNLRQQQWSVLEGGYQTLKLFKKVANNSSLRSSTWVYHIIEGSIVFPLFLTFTANKYDLANQFMLSR